MVHAIKSLEKKESLTRRSVIAPKVSQTSFLVAAKEAMDKMVYSSSKIIHRKSPDTRIMDKGRSKFGNSFHQSNDYFIIRVQILQV
jgi:hypothetical protein